MSALLLLIACLVLGVLVAHFARPPQGLAQNLNWWVLNIALPALVIDVIPRIHIDAHLWFLIVSNWLVFGGAWMLFALLARVLGWSRARTGALVLVAGLGNTAFIGYPFVEALRGREGLALAVVGDQVGCFTALAVGGIAVTAVYAGRTFQPLQLLKRIVLFPTFLALIVGLAIGAVGDLPQTAHAMLEELASTLTPLALFSVGLQLRPRLQRSQLGALGLGLSWKMLLAPALCYLLGVVTDVKGLVLTVGVLQAAMPPMVSAAILADQYDLEPVLANSILGVGILLSFATVPLLNRLL